MASVGRKGVERAGNRDEAARFKSFPTGLIVGKRVGRVKLGPVLPATDGLVARQPRVGQVEPVHDLVVVVPRCCIRIAGEHIRVGPLEKEVTALFQAEHRVLLRVIKTVFIVRDDFAGLPPGAGQRIGFEEPDLTHHRAAKLLDGNHDPAFTVRVPVNRTGVQQDRLARLPVGSLKQAVRRFQFTGRDKLLFQLRGQRNRIGLPAKDHLAVRIAFDLKVFFAAARFQVGVRLVLRRVLQGFGVGRDTGERVRIGKMDIRLLTLLVNQGVAGWEQRSFHIEFFDPFELGFLIVETDQPTFVHLHRWFDFDVGGEQLLAALPILEHDQSIDPSRSLPRHLGSRFGEAGLVDPVVQVDSPVRVQASVGR